MATLNRKDPGRSMTLEQLLSQPCNPDRGVPKSLVPDTFWVAEWKIHESKQRALKYSPTCSKTKYRVAPPSAPSSSVLFGEADIDPVEA